MGIVNNILGTTGGGGTKEYNDLASLPLVGQTNILYLAKDTGILYYWDTDTLQYKAISGKGSGEVIDGECNTYANLPSASTHNGEVWLVKQNSGIIYVNQKVAGLYLSNGTTWNIITPIDINGYQRLITSAIDGNIILTNAQGQGYDSGESIANLLNRANHTGTQSSSTLLQATIVQNYTALQNGDTQEVINNKLFGQVYTTPYSLIKTMNYSDTLLSLGIVKANFIIDKIKIICNETIDVTSLLSIGVVGDLSSIITTSEMGDLLKFNLNDGLIAEYSINNTGFVSNTEVFATLTQTGATQGSFKIILDLIYPV